MVKGVDSALPEPGFYYHFWRKLCKKEEVNQYAYEVLFTSFDGKTRTYSVNYRLLYGDPTEVQSMPLQMFMRRVRMPGKKYLTPLYRRIRNPRTIRELKPIRDRMYPKAA